MKPESIIVEELPDTAFSCKNLRGLSIEMYYNGSPIVMVDCSLFSHKTLIRPFINRLTERCVLCPLIIKKEHKRGAIQYSNEYDELKERNKVLEDVCEILRRQNTWLWDQVFSDDKPEDAEAK